MNVIDKEKKPLLTIITPCHNSAIFVHRLLDSVLEQSYPNVEMIMVDNASADNTASVIESYIQRFEKKGYSLHYHRQGDMGPSGGLKTGMQFMHGDYLTFPDSDDFYACSNALETMVEKLESLSDEYALVRTQVQQIDEQTMQPCGMFGNQLEEGETRGLFEDCLFARNGYYYVNIGFMIRVSALKEIVGINFYTTNTVGPGRQIYMPLYFYKKCYSIKKVLSNYLIRRNSISHGDYAKYQVRKELYEQNESYFNGFMSPIHDLSFQKVKWYKNAFMYQETESIANLAKFHNRRDYLRYKLLLVKYSNEPCHELVRFTKIFIKTVLGK